MRPKHVVRLTPDDRARCEELIGNGQAPTRSVLHAQVLLKTDVGPGGPGWTDAAIAEAFSVSTVTVANIRKTLLREGLEAALRHYRMPPRKYPHKLDRRGEERLFALACSKPPEGRYRWSLRLLSRRMVELGYVDSLCHETVGRVLRRAGWRPAPLVIASSGLGNLRTM